MNTREVEMILCGFSANSPVGKSLYNVGLLEGPDSVQYADDLNSALESCENELLKAFYDQRDQQDKKQAESRGRVASLV
jgi:sulfate permease, SulP family